MPKKDVLYIDGEDDITLVIDKVTSSSADILALVLPKRFATLKSSVNMKLLKKTADKDKKKLVLITEESSLLPLAGNAGIHVSSTLKSRPSVPKKLESKPSDSVVEESPEETPADTAKEDTKKKPSDGKNSSTSKTSSEKSAKIKSIKESAKIRVPNFDRFRVRVVLAVLGVIGLIAGWFVAFNVLPEANIVIEAQTSRVATNVEFSVDPSAQADDIENDLVAGQVQEISKTVTERFDATGEKDVGQKASGTMTVQNCDSSSTLTLPAGTTFTDNTTGFNFVSDSAVDVPGGSFNGGGCSSPGEADVAVTAAASGDSRNLSSRSYSVAGQSSFISGFGGNMTGGTSEIVKTITEDDIDQAKKRLANKTDDKILPELNALFVNEEIVIAESFDTKRSAAKSSVAAGAEAEEGSVSAEFTYSIIGVTKESVSAILEKQQSEQVDTNSQTILDNGVDKVEIEVGETGEDGIVPVTASTDGFIGPDINTDELAAELEGKRFSEAVDFIKSRPGINRVDLDLTPFWVFSVPNPEKTTITIEISDEVILQ